MKAFQILFAAIFLAACFSTANAQLCGKWTFSVSVFDGKGKAVSGAKVKFENAPAGDAARSAEFKKTGGADNIFKVEFIEGDKVSGKYKIRVSAEGFVDSVKRVKIEYCRSSAVKIVLAARPKAARSYV